MNKPNPHLDLTKTNYWANLKRKAKNPKDEKEQATVNAELMNCIDILEKRINKIHEEMALMLSSMERENDITGHIVAHLNAIEESIGREKVREIFEKQQNGLQKEDEKESEN